MGYAPINDEFIEFVSDDLVDLTGSFEASRELEKEVKNYNNYLSETLRFGDHGTLQVWVPNVNGDVWIAGDRQALENLRSCINIALEEPRQFAGMLPHSSFSVHRGQSQSFMVSVQLAESLDLKDGRLRVPAPKDEGEDAPPIEPI